MSIWSAASRRRCARPTTTPSGARASYVDTRAGATKEAGDIVQPLARASCAGGIVADLHELARGQKAGRGKADEITLFKSVGAALEDLAAGIAVYRKIAG